MKQKLKIIAIVLLVIAAAFYAGQCSNDSEFAKFREKFKAQQDSSIQVLAENAKLKLRQDSILASNKEKDDSIAAAHARIDTLQSTKKKQDVAIGKLRARNDSLYTSLEPFMDDSTKMLVAGLNEEIDSLNSRNQTTIKELGEWQDIASDWKGKAENFEAAANLATMRAESAEAEVKKYIDMPVPKDPNKLLGIIPMPSRTASFFAGAAASLIVVAAVN